MYVVVFFEVIFLNLKFIQKRCEKQTKTTLKEGNIYSHYNLQEGLSALGKFVHNRSNNHASGETP